MKRRTRRWPRDDDCIYIEFLSGLAILTPALAVIAVL